MWWITFVFTTLTAIPMLTIQGNSTFLSKCSVFFSCWQVISKTEPKKIQALASRGGEAMRYNKNALKHFKVGFCIEVLNNETVLPLCDIKDPSTLSLRAYMRVCLFKSAIVDTNNFHSLPESRQPRLWCARQPSWTSSLLSINERINLCGSLVNYYFPTV